MINDEALYALWLTASRQVGQPQCAYPQLDTLREFAKEIWNEGRESMDRQDCPYG